MKKIRTGILHYSAPPVVGGVEAVLEAHMKVFSDSGYPVTVIAGKGSASTVPQGVEVTLIPEVDSQNPEVLAVSASLEQGIVPDAFYPLRDKLVKLLRPIADSLDVLIIHNVMTKHFNLPLTAALAMLIEEGMLRHTVAWCHDFTWTSPNSRSKVFPGYPWDLLRKPLAGVRYVTISEHRQDELAGLLGLPQDQIEVIYNGVDPYVWYGLSAESWGLVHRLDLLSADLIMIMPVRVTQAKNIELALRVLSALKSRACLPRLLVTGPPDPHEPASMDYYRSLLAMRKSLGVQEEMVFVYESGPDPREPYLVSQSIVADLMRVSDVMFMPSHREGFGMPVLEAGLLGIPVVCSEKVPAAREIGRSNIMLFDPEASPESIADRILSGTSASQTVQFRRQVRQSLAWERIFTRQILPLLHQGL